MRFVDVSRISHTTPQKLKYFFFRLLDDLYPAVTPKHELGNPTAFTNQVQAAAEHLLAVVDGKQKDVFGGSYSQIKEVIGKIHESGYLDQPSVILLMCFFYVLSRLFYF